MIKIVPLLILSFFFIAASVTFAQVPVMRGLPALSGTGSPLNRNEQPGQPQNQSGWGKRGRGGTSSFGSDSAPLPRLGVRPQNEMIIKKNVGLRGVVEEPCPTSVRLARKRAAQDASAFVRKSPSGTWELFMHKFRQHYSTCSPFIKRAYLEAAKEVIVPKKKAMFQR